MPFQPQKTLAVDVDGTLHHAGVPHEAAIELCREKKADGFFIILWSARGAEHAREAARSMGIDEIFDVIISKPGYILDDTGWDWTRYVVTVVLPPRAEPQ